MSYSELRYEYPVRSSYYRAQSISPSLFSERLDSYGRSSSVGPRSSSYETTTRSYIKEPSASYTREPYTSYVRESSTYSPRTWTTPINDSYLRARFLPPLSEDHIYRAFTPRDTGTLSVLPYETYSCKTPTYQRTEYNYSSNAANSTYPRPRNTSRYASSYLSSPPSNQTVVHKIPSHNKNTYVAYVHSVKMGKE